MKILIDADGCPVTEFAVKLANTYKIKALIFCDTSHEFAIDGAEVITVSKGADSADFALVNKAETGDIVITQDYGLAAMSLAKRATIITQNGLIINDFNVDNKYLQFNNKFNYLDGSDSSRRALEKIIN